LGTLEPWKGPGYT
jgi:hypothetical protein